MHILRARLVDFRNLDVTLELTPGFNIFYGPNGQGKTNILEGFHVACHGKSFRPGKLQDLVRFGADFARVELSIDSGGVEIPLSAVVANGQRRLTAAGKENCTVAETGEVLRLIFFGPEDLDLVKGSASNRRNFVDRAIVVHHPPYSKVVTAYQRLMSQRNALLKELRRGQVPPADLMESFEEGLAGHGAQMLVYRQRYLRQFIPAATELVSLHTAGKLALSARYAGTLTVAEKEPEVAEVVSLLTRSLAESRDDDAQAGRTLVGPHADDLELEVNGKPARFFASQGEQRQVAVSLKMAQLSLWKERFDVRPVLLLDDIMSELDPERARLLFAQIARLGIQTHISTTEKPDVILEEKYRLFEVNDGKVRQLA